MLKNDLQFLVQCVQFGLQVQHNARWFGSVGGYFCLQHLHTDTKHTQLHHTLTLSLTLTLGPMSHHQCIRGYFYNEMHYINLRFTYLLTYSHHHHSRAYHRRGHCV